MQPANDLTKSVRTKTNKARIPATNNLRLKAVLVKEEQKLHERTR